MRLILIISVITYSPIAIAGGAFQNNDVDIPSSWRINSREVKKKDRPLRNPLNPIRKLVEFPSWGSNIVPYVVDPNLDENIRRIIFGAMGEITRRTSFRFKPKWSSESKYLNIIKSQTCEVTVTGPGNEIIRFQVGKNCVKHQGIMKMILKSLGIPPTQGQCIGSKHMCSLMHEITHSYSQPPTYFKFLTSKVREMVPSYGNGNGTIV